MSAGRKKGDNLDRYDTPPEVTQAFLSAWDPKREPRHIWEPAAGSGLMVAPLCERFGSAVTIRATDLVPRAEGISVLDFLESQADAYNLIITNPPFRLAEQFLRHGMERVTPGGYVVLLLRAAFLESKRRANLLTQYPPIEVYFLRSRPRFTGPNSDGATTDTAMYAWFVWRKGARPAHFEGYVL